ncbi:hypothetical protein [Bradyrhizobium sp. SZCCHNS3053]|uniref:hypothetical protein n=1 Tax=Bradyrhizobium sp. SZCCHNS3053 TaxID=3057322 RepID=UPI0029160F10|nr:hypothetical protein [Bradyrhizobium sp. SZCCHNS3053]
MSEISDEQAGKPVVSARLNGSTLRAKWQGKRWHGRYATIDEVCDAAHADGLEAFVIDYVDEED